MKVEVKVQVGPEVRKNHEQGNQTLGMKEVNWVRMTNFDGYRYHLLVEMMCQVQAGSLQSFHSVLGFHYVQHPEESTHVRDDFMASI